MNTLASELNAFGAVKAHWVMNIPLPAVFEPLAAAVVWLDRQEVSPIAID